MNIRSLLTGFSLGIVGAFFGSLFSYLFSERRRRKEEFSKAATEFRLAFWPEVEFLDKRFLIDRASRNAEHGKSCDILFKAVGRHQNAVFLFCDHLSCINKTRFKKAWDEYCKGGSNWHYFAEEYPCDNPLQQSISEDKALKRIYALLEFAKSK